MAKPSPETLPKSSAHQGRPSSAGCLGAAIYAIRSACETSISRSSAFRSRENSRFPAGRRPRRSSSSHRSRRVAFAGAANACLTPATARRSTPFARRSNPSRAAIEAGADRGRLQALLPPGAARNALDCALWDLAAKSSGVPAHALAGLPAPAPATTAFTISVGEPGRDGGGGGQGELAASVENQARGGGRPGADRRHSRRRAGCGAHRRRQRGLDGSRPFLPSRGLRRSRRRAGRAASAGGPRRGARQDPAHHPCLRRRKRSRPARPRRTRRPLRRRQFEARQDGWPDRDAGHGGGSRGGRLRVSSSAAWWRPRSPWPRRFCSPRGRAFSISTDPCCWSGTGRTASFSKAPSSIPLRPPSGADFRSVLQDRGLPLASQCDATPFLAPVLSPQTSVSSFALRP